METIQDTYTKSDEEMGEDKMSEEYRLIKQIDTWKKEPLCYAVQIRKHWWIFSWWEYLRDDVWGSIVLFGNKKDAIRYAKEFIKGRIVWLLK